MKRTVIAVAVALTTAGAAVVACSSKGSSGNGNSAEITAACMAVASSVCMELQGCNPYALDEQYGDEPTCEMRQVLNCTNALNAPGTGATPTSEQACAEAESPDALSCTNDLDKSTPTACNPQAGSGSNGAACAFAAQCQSAFCAIQPGSLCGRCAAAPTAGASCLQLTTCGVGLICSGGVCSQYVQAGGGCGKGAPCGPGLSCVGETTTAMGKCTAAGTSMGQACDPTLKTGAGCNSLDGLTCNTVKKTCQTIAKAMPGQPCGNNVGTKTGGYQEIVCGGGGAATCAANKCVPVVMEGSACNTATGPDCMAPARCIGSPANDAGAFMGMCEVPDGTMCH